MEARLNRCPTHPDKIKHTICFTCKNICCDLCSKDTHLHHNNKIVNFTSRLQDSHEFLGVLGIGYFDYVLSAKNSVNGMVLAIKFIDQVTDEQQFQEIAGKIKIWCQLHHPNILECYNADFLKDEDNRNFHGTSRKFAL